MTNKCPNFVVGKRMFLFKPAEKTREARKLARPYYQLVELEANTAHICHVDCHQDETIPVALSRLWRCPDEVPDECWPLSPKGHKKISTPTNSETSPTTPLEEATSLGTEPEAEKEPCVSQRNKWAGRLQRHPHTSARGN